MSNENQPIPDDEDDVIPDDPTEGTGVSAPPETAVNAPERDDPGGNRQVGDPTGNKPEQVIDSGQADGTTPGKEVDVKLSEIEDDSPDEDTERSDPILFSDIENCPYWVGADEDLKEDFGALGLGKEDIPAPPKSGVIAVQSADVRLACAWVRAAQDQPVKIFDLSRNTTGEPIEEASLLLSTLSEIIRDAVDRLVVINLGAQAGVRAELGDLDIESLLGMDNSGHLVVLTSHAWTPETEAYVSRLLSFVSAPDDQILAAALERVEAFRPQPLPDKVSTVVQQLGWKKRVPSARTDMEAFLDQLFEYPVECIEEFFDELQPSGGAELTETQQKFLQKLLKDERSEYAAASYLLIAFESLSMGDFERLYPVVIKEISPSPSDDEAVPVVSISNKVIRKCDIRIRPVRDGQRRMKLKLAWRDTLDGKFETLLPVLRRNIELSIIRNAAACLSLNDKAVQQGLADLAARLLVEDGQLGGRTDSELLAGVLYSAEMRRLGFKVQESFLRLVCDSLHRQRSDFDLKDNPTGKVIVRLLSPTAHGASRQPGDSHRLGWSFCFRGRRRHCADSMAEMVGWARRDPETVMAALYFGYEPNVENMPRLLMSALRPFNDLKEHPRRKDQINRFVSDVIIWGWLIASRRDSNEGFSIGTKMDASLHKDVVCELARYVRGIHARDVIEGNLEHVIQYAELSGIDPLRLLREKLDLGHEVILMPSKRQKGFVRVRYAFEHQQFHKLDWRTLRIQSNGEITVASTVTSEETARHFQAISLAPSLVALASLLQNAPEDLRGDLKRRIKELIRKDDPKAKVFSEVLRTIEMLLEDLLWARRYYSEADWLTRKDRVRNRKAVDSIFKDLRALKGYLR